MDADRIIIAGHLAPTPVSTEVLDAGQLSLAELADQIKANVRAAVDHARNATERAIAAGEMLNKAKSMVPHGGWNEWLTLHCVLAPRTASSYMRLAKQFAELPDSNRQRVADLPVRKAVQAICAEAAPPARQREAQMPRAKDDRERVIKKFDKAAKSIREASRTIFSIKPEKVAVLRNQITAVLEELDRMQRSDEGGGRRC